MVYKAKEEVLRQVLDDTQYRRVLSSFIKVVQASFQEEARRRAVFVQMNATRDEIKRRTNMCYTLFMTMRCEAHYSLDHALDVLSTALRSELDGVRWEPNPNQMVWAPSKGARG